MLRDAKLTKCELGSGRLDKDFQGSSEMASLGLDERS